MSVIDRYTETIYPHVMMGTSGTGGDLVYVSTGSALTLKSNANSGTENTSAFLGVLIDSTVKGSYGAVISEGVVSLEKLLTANVIEIADRVYADGAAADNKVGTVAGGTCIGICAVRSGSTDPRVSVKLLSFSSTGAGGFNA